LKTLLKILVIKILRFTHKQKNIAVIFQNDEDKNIFLSNRIIKAEQAYKIKGSGIDLQTFTYVPEPNDTTIRILFTARMLKDKGVFELAEAASLLKEQYQNTIEFLLCGDIDDNPQSLTKDELNSIADGQYIKWLGRRTDVRELLEQSHIFVFPSYYREGLPKSLIEACAVGRPVVTTNSIGCKDCVIDGYNGFLIPIKDSRALADKLEILIQDKSLRMSMGKNSRCLAEQDFSIEKVIESHLKIYDKLIKDSPS
jgi:glycosyltransferase involved in cell wall biosynthesis